MSNLSKANALSLAMFDELHRGLEDANVGVVLLSGEGSAFCSGLDLDEIVELGTPEAHLVRLRDFVYAMERHSATTISIVSGSVVAGGIALACCTDLNVAEKTALLSVPRSEEYEPLVRFLKTLVFAYRPQRNSDPFAGGQIRACEPTTLIDETFSDKNDDPLKTAMRLAESRRIPKRRIGARQRASIDEALSEAIRPDSVTRLLRSRGRLDRRLR